jgi:hypothetical protein
MSVPLGASPWSPEIDPLLCALLPPTQNVRPLSEITSLVAFVGIVGQSDQDAAFPFGLPTLWE